MSSSLSTSAKVFMAATFIIAVIALILAIVFYTLSAKSTEFTALKTNVATLSTNAAATTTDVNTLKTDVITLKTDVNTLKSFGFSIQSDGTLTSSKPFLSNMPTITATDNMVLMPGYMHHLNSNVQTCTMPAGYTEGSIIALNNFSGRTVKITGTFVQGNTRVVELPDRYSTLLMCSNNVWNSLNRGVITSQTG